MNSHTKFRLLFALAALLLFTAFYFFMELVDNQSDWLYAHRFLNVLFFLIPTAAMIYIFRYLKK